MIPTALSYVTRPVKGALAALALTAMMFTGWTVIGTVGLLLGLAAGVATAWLVLAERFTREPTQQEINADFGGREDCAPEGAHPDRVLQVIDGGRG